ncbi:MAG: hypothetical protein KGP29_05450 [Proteobacteria bacterium]|nr:hypothetical protein [Pseudomonadota bacterium]
MSIIPTQEELKREAYQYFNNHVRPIETYINEQGVMKARDIVSGEVIGLNDDLDAFRHSYVMGKLTLSGYQSSVVKWVGIDHESGDANNPEEKDMDLWNNSIGIRIGGIALDEEDLGNRLKTALENGQLITSPRLISNEERSEVQSIAKEALSDALSFGNRFISSFIQTVFNTLLSAEESVLLPTRRVDPLTLDLDNDGIELVNVTSSTAFFDLDVIANEDGTYTSDGVKEQVGWVNSDDGLLTLDKNGNGEVDNILELFGKTNKTGTQELREYDLNDAEGASGVGDGVINSNDSVFSELRVWQDFNQNGLSEASKINKLRLLSDYKIASLEVAQGNFCN